MKRWIDGREVLRDLVGGMTGEVLQKKYDLSSKQLSVVLKQLLAIRIRRVNAILDDIRTGLTYSQLLEKYQLSPGGLAQVTKEFVEPRRVKTEGSQISGIPSNGESKRVDLRNALRNFPSVLVSVCEPGKRGTACQLNDITESGVGISGIEAQVGDIKTIAVLGDELGQVTPFEFQAECRWTGTQEPHGLPCAGFRITKISDEDFGLLRDFIGRFTFAIEDD